MDGGGRHKYHTGEKGLSDQDGHGAAGLHRREVVVPRGVMMPSNPGPCEHAHMSRGFYRNDTLLDLVRLWLRGWAGELSAILGRPIASLMSKVWLRLSAKLGRSTKQRSRKRFVVLPPWSEAHSGNRAFPCGGGAFPPDIVQRKAAPPCRLCLLTPQSGVFAAVHPHSGWAVSFLIV